MKVKVNKRYIDVKQNITVLQACREGGVNIPRFCYHERLMIAGNCRMCLVEVEKSLKPLAGCAMPVMHNMSIFTDTVVVKKAREGVMELLLANHPLDCPICDQGGECDLQDQALVFGSDRGRFYEMKRSVVDKNFGVFIKTVMTRCIHCTRCVRFSSTHAGIGDLGVTGRGNKMEISTYVSNILLSEISGNIIDLCPVGALTSKPFAYIARSWELENVESVDLFDNFGSNITLSVRGNKLMKVLPLINEELNEEWITDKCRFSYDGFYKQRLLKPLLRKNGLYEDITWEEALGIVMKKLLFPGVQVDGVVGNGVELESAYVFKLLLQRVGNYSISTENTGVMENIDFFDNYGFQFPLDELDEKDFCLLIGGNLRLESPLLLLKLRRRQSSGDFIICSIGSTVNYFADVLNIGSGAVSYFSVIEGKNYSCSKLLQSKGSVLIYSLNSSGFSYGCGDFFWNSGLFLKSLLFKSNMDVNFINLGSNGTGLHDLGIGVPKRRCEDGVKSKKILYLLDSDETDINKERYDFIVYQGHHGDRNVVFADLILPGLTNIEKDGLFVNFQGIVQKSKYVLSGSGESRSDWRILKSLLDFCFFSNHQLSEVDNLSSLRKVLFNEVPFMLNNRRTTSVEETLKEVYLVTKSIYNNTYRNYYMTNSISRSSNVMALASKKIVNYVSNYRWL